jgi:hypothetical protein
LIIKYSSGDVETFVNVAPDIFYCNEEGSSYLCLATSIKENSALGTEAKIYPNPVKDELVIEVKKNNLELKMQIIISDVCGKIITSKSCYAEKDFFRVSTKHLSPGAYLLQTRGKNSVYNLKFVKE